MLETPTPFTPHPSPATNHRLVPAGVGNACCLALVAILFLATGLLAEEPTRKVREIFVPFDALDVLLEGQPQRVLLSREEYEQLWQKARKHEESLGPLPAAIVAADYTVTVADERVQFAGTLAIDVLDEGIYALALDLSGVGLRRAAWTGKDGASGPAAAIGRSADGRLTLFVEGKGRRQLKLDMVAPLQATAAQQVVAMRLPRPPAARMTLTVPGDVEIKSGADVASRVVDAAAKQTQFELVPKAGDTTLVMTLNSHLHRRDRAVLARSVLVDELTEAYERIHATVSLAILHQAVGRFRFAVPEGFEVTEVSSPLLSRWAMATEGKQRVLEVRLREQTTETVVLSLSALKTSPRAQRWTFPKLSVLDVDGQVAVVGLLVDQRLQTESLAAEGLISIDTGVLVRALPATVLRAEPGSPTLRPVAAYYAPQADFGLTAQFVKPPARIYAATNLLLVLEERGPRVQGSFTLTPEFEKLFGFEFSVPEAWQVTAVTAADKSPLFFERYGAAGQAGRVRVRLARGVTPGQAFRLDFAASAASGGLLVDRESTEFDFPVFAVAGAARDAGAIAIDAREDLVVRPKKLELLTPLGENEKPQYGLAGVPASLAYRYDSQPYRAALSVERTQPRLTARTFSFLRVEPDALAAHYEILYQVEEARTQQLSLSLPESTPAALSIRGLDNVRLKEFVSQPAGGARRWNVLLAEARRGRVRLSIDFQQPYSVGEEKSKSLELPLVRAEGVAYQSGMVAVEGSAELDVQAATSARRLDVGELVDAEYQPGRRLLGAYGFSGEPAKVEVTVARHPGYWIDPAIVQKAELTTFLSANGVSQTAALFRLRTKALYLEVQLPGESQLWSAQIDGKPIKPQRQDKSLLMSLPAAPPGGTVSLQMVYETPVSPVALAGQVELSAPVLVLHRGSGSQRVEVPMADLVWRLCAPAGYHVYRSAGSVVAQLPAPEPAALLVFKAVAGSLLYSPGPLFTLQGCGCIGGCGSSRPYPKTAAAPAAATPSPYYLKDETQFPPSAPSTVLTSRRRDEESKFDMSPSLMGEFAERNGKKTERPKRTGRPSAEKEVAGMSAPGVFSADIDLAGDKRSAVGGPADVEMAMPRSRELKEEAKKDAESKPREPAKSEAGRPERRLDRSMLGFSSLKIDLQETAEGAELVEFQSLGVEPRLVVTLASTGRLNMLGWALALAVLLAGFWLTNRRPAAKTRFVLGVFLAGTLLALAPGLEPLAGPCNAAVYAAALLVPYYLLARLARWLTASLSDARSRWRQAAATTGVVFALACVVPMAFGVDGPPSSPTPLSRAGEGSLEATSKENKENRYVVQVVEPAEPVKIPEDAVILPYDPDSKTGVQQATKMLVPYAKYVELWNLAHPDKKLDAPKPPASFALAGASYAATLEGDESLTVQGRLEIDVYADGFVAVPFGLAGCVLSRAELDGKPARVSVAAPALPQPVQQKANVQDRPSGRGLVVLHVSGKGRRQFQLAVRLRLDRRGGWRVAEGTLPAAPASQLTITVPQAKTEVRLGQVTDRRAYETDQANQKIETALGPAGLLSLQWRPKVAEGQVDRSLTAQSRAVLDVQEDGLRAVWQLSLAFPRSQREAFHVRVPSEYLVEKVEGTNVRGWESRKEEGRQSLKISLLKPAKDHEQFTIRLWRGGAAGRDKLAEFDVPMVLVPDASLHNGDVTIRRSPLLELRTVSISGATRTDLPAEPNRSGAGAGADESPLGIRAHQAYHFVATPFAIRLAAAAVPSRVTAEVATLLKISDYQRNLETRVKLDVRDRPLHEVRILLPNDLRLDEVVVPGDFLWALTRQGERPLLTVYLAAGRQGETPILIRGLLGRRGPVEQVALPAIEVLGVERQQGDVAVQLDPVFEAQAKDLKHCESVLLERLFGWLNPQQRQATRLAIHYARPDYQGVLQLSLRRPIVACNTISNVRVTDRAVEETILLNFNIQQAGVRGLTFLLPAWMAGSRISVPMLREKSIEPVGDAAGSPLRVSLELQDEVMGELRVLVQNDRLLTVGSKGKDGDQSPAKPRGETAPIPVVETVRTERRAEKIRADRQFVVLENVSRDELVVESFQQLERVGRSQKDWATLRSLLGDNITQAYVVSLGATQPQLLFRTQQRTMAETGKARIRFAETRLVLDAHGAYRAQQLYKVDNETEQFLVIEMPEGARLWTAWVAGEPVKPTELPGAANPRQIRIPLVKTAAGDLDYDVLLQYGGRAERPGALAPVSFPLIHVQNLGVELSQVRLYLPATHRWFDFGGTLRRVDESEMQAGLSAYQAQQVEELVEIARQGSFSGVRAEDNLKSLLQSGYQGGRQTAPLRLHNWHSALQTNLPPIEQAPAKPPVYDNSSRLNDLFEGQHNARARNVTNELGGNFDAELAKAAQEGREVRQKGGRAEGIAMGGGKFNTDWLDKNQIANAPNAQAGEPKSRLAPASKSPSGPQSGKKFSFLGRASTTDQPDVELEVTPRDRPAAMVPQTVPSRTVENRAQDVLSRYQQKYRQQQQMEVQQQAQVGKQLAPAPPPGPGMPPSSSAERDTYATPSEAPPATTPAQIDRFAVGGRPRDVTELSLESLQSATVSDGSSATAVGAGGATGLASLSVDLPLCGVEYLFTTPRGDVELSARAVPQQTIVHLLQAAAAVAVILVLLGLGRLAGQGRFAWLAGHTGSTALIALGILSVLFGVALLSGVLALAAGITFKARHALDKRVAPA